MGMDAGVQNRTGVGAGAQNRMSVNAAGVQACGINSCMCRCMEYNDLDATIYN
jgi:hypothetical protein